MKGMWLGGAIELLPVIGGQGGAYVAIITFPLGLITGAIIDVTAKLYPFYQRTF